jgi:aspartyl-tRNA(Asn)/glutamyl-tRNA(Gln) amidotransferase subunit B
MLKVVIGLEIHAELKTKSKIFCSCINDPDNEKPNVNVCPVCMAHPGSLPVINKDAVRKVIKTGLALNCDISEVSKFDRKNYFYPDLPKGYQISQFDEPLCNGGELNIDGRKIDITRIHLEEDTGKLSHPDGTNYSLINYNRAGVPLMELVTEPVITSAQEAKRFAEELQLIFKYLGVSEANMEKGQMRCEANISMMEEDATEFGTKVEIKNLNSFRALERGIEYEIKRQSKVLEDGGEVIQETRGWDDNKEITFSQRAKEEAHDYRYLPDPDLPKLLIENELIDDIKSEMPELPGAKRIRFKEEFKLNDDSIETLVNNKVLGGYFEKVVSELLMWIDEEKLKVSDDKVDDLVKVVANYLISDLTGLLKEASIELSDCKINPENFAEFVVLIFEGKITSKTAKDVLKRMFEDGSDPSHIIESEGLAQTSDEGEIGAFADQVISENPDAVEKFKAGKESIVMFLVGKVMALSKGKANPGVVKDLLLERLK